MAALFVSRIIQQEMGRFEQELSATQGYDASWKKVSQSMASQNVMEFTSNNWQKEVVESDKPVLVDFWAPWCGPCRMLGPTIEKVATQFAGKVKVGKLNVDDSPDLAAQYGVTSIPRVFIFKGGDKPRHQLVGLTAEAEIVKLLNGVMES
jgi:thioredoxin 1